MGWTLLLAAGVAEIVFAVSLKLNEGLTRLWPSVLTGASGLISFYFLMLALRSLPLGTAYAVWTGIGAVGVALVGMVYFHEAANWPRLLSMSLVIAGLIGLKLSHAD
ncbi:MAG: multidrug efflux SMR transporter [Methylococcales bacterium]|nr:multidrug efflux SMR transporter [Methylococcales bacterium]